jgi:hypothetical protein
MKQLQIKAAVILGGIAIAAWGFAAAPAVAQDASESARDTAPKTPNDPGYVLEDRPGRITGGRKECIFFRTLYDWRPLNNTHLIVWAPSRRQPYHIQLDRPCWGLRFAQSLGFYSRDFSLCAYGGDAIIVNDGIVPERCSISAITKLSEEALKSLLDQAPGRRRGTNNSDDTVEKE